MGRPRNNPVSEGRRLFTPVDSFVADVDGVPQSFRAGETLVREGHPILLTHRQLFRLARAHYEVPEVEQATAAPGEVRA